MKLVVDLTATAAPFRPRHPIAPPSLLLDFATGFYGGNAFLDVVTFTRGSTATFFDAGGVLRTAAVDEPRLDHDPATGAALGLLIEESRTNEFLRSEQFDDAAWTKDGATIAADAATAPDGAMTAEKLVEDASSGMHRLYQSVAGDQTRPWTISVFAKAAERSALKLKINFTGSSTTSLTATFDLATETVSGLSAGAGTSGPSASIVAMGNGWYRCSAWCSQGAAVQAGSVIGFAYLSDGTTSDSYAGDGSSGLHLWGAQIESGPCPTSYVPTAAAAVTRAADVAYRTLGNEYNADAGTVVVAFDSAADSFAAIGSKGTAFNRLLIEDSRVYFASGSTAYTAAAFVSMGAGAHKVAAAVDATGISVSIDGGAAAASTGTVQGGTVTQLYLGQNVNGSPFLNGHIASFAYYPTKLPGAELQELTA